MSSPLSRAPPGACSPLQTASTSEGEQPEGPAWGECRGGGHWPLHPCVPAPGSPPLDSELPLGCKQLPVLLLADHEPGSQALQPQFPHESSTVCWVLWSALQPSFRIPSQHAPTWLLTPLPTLTLADPIPFCGTRHRI